MRGLLSIVSGIFIGGGAVTNLMGCFMQYRVTKREMAKRITNLERHTAKRLMKMRQGYERRLADLEREIGLREDGVPF